MKLNIFTLSLNSMPWIQLHLPEFEKLKVDWRWAICHGTSANVGSTDWCRKPEPGLSTDGTSEYLNCIRNHPNVTILEKPLWEKGKDQMVNACLDTFKDPGVLLQADSDEIWKAEQLEKIVKIFQQRPDIGHMRFFCRYFVGEDIITVGENCYGCNKFEWARAWRWEPGTYFKKHEPPIIPYKGSFMGRHETRNKGLVFDHFSWSNEENVKRKIEFYGYGDRAFEGWKRLQANKVWPCNDLSSFLPWVGKGVKVARCQTL